VRIPQVSAQRGCPDCRRSRSSFVQNESASGSLSREALVEQPSPELLADKVDALLKMVNGTEVINT